MLTSLDKVRRALLTVTDKCYHYTAAKSAKDKYIVWAEDGDLSPAPMDNMIPSHVIEGTIDYYTKDEDDTAMARIPAALNTAGIAWALNSVQYEDETRLIHYEWIFRVRQDYDGVTV